MLSDAPPANQLLLLSWVHDSLCVSHHCDSATVLSCPMFPVQLPPHPAPPLALPFTKDASVVTVILSLVSTSGQPLRPFCAIRLTFYGEVLYCFCSHCTPWTLSSLIKESLDMLFWRVTFTFREINIRPCSRRRVLVLSILPCGPHFTSFGGWDCSHFFVSL